MKINIFNNNNYNFYDVENNFTETINYLNDKNFDNNNLLIKVFTLLNADYYNKLYYFIYFDKNLNIYDYEIDNFVFLQIFIVNDVNEYLKYIYEYIIFITQQINDLYITNYHFINVIYDFLNFSYINSYLNFPYDKYFVYHNKKNIINNFIKFYNDILLKHNFDRNMIIDYDNLLFNNHEDDILYCHNFNIL